MIEFELAFDNPKYNRVVMCCSSQEGKTDGILDVIGCRLDSVQLQAVVCVPVPFNPIVVMDPEAEFPTNTFCLSFEMAIPFGEAMPSSGPAIAKTWPFENV